MSGRDTARRVLRGLTDSVADVAFAVAVLAVGIAVVVTLLVVVDPGMLREVSTWVDTGSTR